MANNPDFITKIVPVTRAVPQTITAANTAFDGTGATGRALVLTAGGANIITYIEKLRVKARGTVADTVVRVFKNNGSDVETASNNALIAEIKVDAYTASQTAKSPEYDIPLNLYLLGHASTPERLYVTTGVANAAGITITPINAGENG